MSLLRMQKTPKCIFKYSSGVWNADAAKNGGNVLRVNNNFV